MKKETLLASALLLGAMATNAAPQETEKGILVSKDDRGAVVRDCATERLITVRYGTPGSYTFLIGETVGYIYTEGQQIAVLTEHYPEAEGCGYYHS